MSTTAIEWTDRVWNPVTGCTKVSAGCKHCYAETIADRFWATQYPAVEIETCGPQGTITRPRRFTDVLTHEDRLTEPLRWRKPARVFVNSMSDLFHEDVPDEFIDRVFAVMALAHRHTFQILTKRPDRMRAYLIDAYRKLEVARHIHARVGDAAARQLCGLWTWPLPNVWLGVSCENQETADARIPLLFQTPSAVRFVSAEPLLGPIDFERGGFTLLERIKSPSGTVWPGLDWVIVGGESGPTARPCDVAWIESIVGQCQAASVPVFVKQVGSVVRVSRSECLQFAMCGSWSADGPGAAYGTAKPSDRKGGDPSEWPEAMRVREFPAVSA